MTSLKTNLHYSNGYGHQTCQILTYHEKLPPQNLQWGDMQFAMRWFKICNFLNEVVLWDHVTNEICMSTFSGFMDTKLGKVLIYCIMATKLCSWQTSTRKTLRSSLFVCVKIVLWLGVTIDKLYMYILVLMKFCLVIVSIEQLFSFWVYI